MMLSGVNSNSGLILSDEVDINRGISTFSSVCISINMMIGAGMLALPSGFVTGGLFSSLLILGGICYWMIISCIWEGRAVVMCGRILKISKIPEGYSFFLFNSRF